MTQASIEEPEIIDGDIGSGVLILCDHATNAMPPEYASLGLPAAELERHIAFDVGAADTSRKLAHTLGAPAILSRFSRLLIDPNRGTDDPTLVMRVADGAVVPGNARIDDKEIAARLKRFYRPYDRAIGAAIANSLAAGIVPAIISIHSFTPSLQGRARPWHCGLLFDADERIAKPLIAALAQDKTLVIGANEPYDGALEGDTLDRHAGRPGLANVLVEIRQDLISARHDAEAWGERLAAALRGILADPGIHAIKPHASRVHTRHLAAAKDEQDDPMQDGSMAALEVVVFRRLVAHLRERSDVQNIDLMNLAGFCRNCLSNWLKDAADAAGRPLSKEESRALVYGMPYEEWRARFQKEATPAQKAAFAAGSSHRH
ncbi:Predicted N-formylglutamate amidohydrolase [Rhizobiales bacterium GAS191]|nr:Predicted N-formylglutamate amidohydrolase [Rhizobiales bacterium GAS191]